MGLDNGLKVVQPSGTDTPIHIWGNACINSGKDNCSRSDVVALNYVSQRNSKATLKPYDFVQVENSETCRWPSCITLPSGTVNLFVTADNIPILAMGFVHFNKKTKNMKRGTGIAFLAILGICCSRYSFDQRMVLANASVTRLRIELGEMPASSKNKFLSDIQKDGVTLEQLHQLLIDDWNYKYERFGNADESDHRAAGCMHVYGKCVLKADEQNASRTLQFFFPDKK